MAVKIYGSNRIDLDGNNETFSIRATADDELNFYKGASTKLMGMDASGFESKPNLPAFLAQAVQSDTTYNDQVIPYPSVIFDNTNNYDNVNYKFTAPISGIYLFSWSTWKSFGGTGRTYIRKNNTQITYYAGNTGIHARTSESDDTDYASATICLNLNVGDYVTIYDGPSSAGTRIFYANYFTGYLIG